MENKTILLVEDNLGDAAVITRILKSHCKVDKVFVVRDGVQALDFLFCQNAYANRNPYDMPQIILTEIKPKIDWLEMLRADGRTRLLPVVVLTSSKIEQDINQIYKLGANSIVRKPEDFSHFVEVVQVLGSYWLSVNEPPPYIPVPVENMPIKQR